MVFRAVVALGLFLTAAVRADVVTDWNTTLLTVIRTKSVSPVAASRAMACVHVAVFDAVNAIDGSYEPYLVEPNVPDSASIEAAAAAAAHGVLLGLYPDQAEALDTALAESLQDIPDGAPKDEGVAVGETVAAAVLAARAADHAADVVEYTPGADVGQWQPTPPTFAPALAPQWPTVTPFAMTSGAQFRSGGPPPLDSAEYAAAFDETKELGRLDSSTRTEDQAQIAYFWANGGGTWTPPGHWNRVAQIVGDARGNTVVENARLFALLNIALADAAIVSWDNKYAFNHWRPVTAIAGTQDDGNEDTQSDPDWLPLLNTPPFPEYTSGHSTFSGAAAKVLERFFGADDVEFTVESDGEPVVLRTYDSFSQAAQESADSRVYAGIHWRYSNQDGLVGGQALGDYVSENFLTALPPQNPPHPRMCGLFGLGQVAAWSALLLGMRHGSARRRRWTTD